MPKFLITQELYDEQEVITAADYQEAVYKTLKHCGIAIVQVSDES